MSDKEINLLEVSVFVSLLVTVKDKVHAFFKREGWQIGKKIKYLMGIAIIAIMLISVFAFLPEKGVTQSDLISLPQPRSTDNPTTPEPPTLTPESPTPTQPPETESTTSSLTDLVQNVAQIFVPQKAPGLIKSAQTINSTVWIQVAKNAWAFYRPGVGVDVNTGLPYAGGSDFPAFTDWDLGSYIQAVIDAQKIGLIGANGTWGSSDRFDKVLTFLENRPLNAYGYPFQFYDATTGSKYNSGSNASANVVDVADTGRLFVALNNLKDFNYAIAPRINNIVLNGRSDYSALLGEIENNRNSDSIYAYYIVSGFASFWPRRLGDVPSTILNNILSSENISTYGVTLPNASICNEPLLSSVFELDNEDSPRLMALMTQVYLACEAYSNSTGQFMAPSEGSKGWGWLYEWVVAPNGEPWSITDASTTFYYIDVPSVVYNKVAFSFLALYNTDYARRMVVWLEDALPNPVNGYYDGISNYGHTYTNLSNIANTLILEAALYAVQKNI